MGSSSERSFKIDFEIKFDKQIKAFVKSIFSLRQLSKMKLGITKKDIKRLIHAFFFTKRLDYCNAPHVEVGLFSHLQIV